MGNDLSGICNVLSPMSYKTARKMWEHVGYIGLTGSIEKHVAIRLLRSFNGVLSTCQLAWVRSIISDPYDDDGVHMVYTFPELLKLYQIKGLVSVGRPIKSINDEYEGHSYNENETIYDKFPNAKEKRDPTLEETILYGLYEGSFSDWFSKNKSPEVELILAQHLYGISAITFNEVNLTAITETAKKIKLDSEKDLRYFDELYGSSYELLMKLFCNQNNISRTTWLNVFQYMFVEPYVYETYRNAPEYTSICVMSGSLKYLLGYPRGSSPPRNVMLCDTLAMFKDPVAHQQRIIEINRKALAAYMDSYPYPITSDVTETALMLPPCELAFVDIEGKINAVCRKSTVESKELQTRLFLTKFIYGKLVSDEHLATVTTLLNMMKEKSYYLEYVDRKDPSADLNI